MIFVRAPVSTLAALFGTYPTASITRPHMGKSLRIYPEAPIDHAGYHGRPTPHSLPHRLVWDVCCAFPCPRTQRSEGHAASFISHRC